MYIVWVKDGYEGYSPSYFNTKEEVITFIQSGSVYGAYIITKEIKLSLTEDMQGHWIDDEDIRKNARFG